MTIVLAAASGFGFWASLWCVVSFSAMKLNSDVASDQPIGSVPYLAFFLVFPMLLSLGAGYLCAFLGDGPERQ